MKHLMSVFLILVVMVWTANEEASSLLLTPALNAISQDPYVGAIAVDADSGTVLFENHADQEVYPASIVKLMDLLIILEKVKGNELRLSDTVTVGPEAAGMGGSQVYLGNGERFTVDDLVYAMIVASANDAAVALAVHLAGSKDAFVQMN